jgi:hypothetical protein
MAVSAITNSKANNNKKKKNTSVAKRIRDVKRLLSKVRWLAAAAAAAERRPRRRRRRRPVEPRPSDVPLSPLHAGYTGAEDAPGDGEETRGP